MSKTNEASGFTGFKSSSFWTMALAQVVNLYLAWADKIPDTLAVWISAGAIAAYMLSRGIGKIGAQYDSKKKPFWKTSEFFVLVIGTAQVTVGALTDVLPPDLAAKIVPSLAAVYSITRRISKIGDPNADLAGMTGGQILSHAKDAAKMIIFIGLIGVASMACASRIGNSTLNNYWEGPQHGFLLAAIDCAEGRSCLSIEQASEIRDALLVDPDSTKGYNSFFSGEMPNKIRSAINCAVESECLEYFDGRSLIRNLNSKVRIVKERTS